MESRFVFHGVRFVVKGHVSFGREVWVWYHKLHMGEVFMYGRIGLWYVHKR